MPQHIHQFPLGLLLVAQLFLLGGRFRPGTRHGVHVGPASGARQTHEDTLDAGVRGAQTEASAAVVDEVKLDVAAAAQLLPLLLGWGEGHVLAALDDGHVGGEEGGEAVGDKRKEGLLGVLRGGGGGLEEGGVEVVEEDAADAAGLAAVGQVEVLVAPGLELGVVGGVVAVAGVLDGLVEVLDVLGEEVAGGQVGAAAEPPVLVAVDGVLGVGGLEVAVVEVDGGGHGVVRVQDEGEAGGEEAERVDVGANEGLVVSAHLLDRGARQLAVDDGDVDAGLFEDVAVLEHARDAAAAVGPRPCVCLELLAVDPAQLLHDLLLVVLDQLLHAEAHRRRLADGRLLLQRFIELHDRRGVEFRYFLGHLCGLV